MGASITKKQEEEAPLYAKCVAEFIGTFLLIFTVGCNVLMAPAAWGATSIACVLMVSIYALGGVSGANFNPAVSFCLALSKILPWTTALIYTAVQLVAGILAGFSYYALCGKAFNLEPKAGWIEAGAAEVLYTFMLCFVVLNVACSPLSGNCPNEFYGLAIGFVIIAGGYGAGAISMGCFNPAVAFGIDVSSAHMGLGWCFVYTAFELFGAALASGAHRFVRPKEYNKAVHVVTERLASEFIGTFFLVLTVGCNVLAKSPAGAFSIAASLMCMIYALGNVSGAHFNPAVTLTILLSGRGKMEGGVEVAMLYMLAQVFGGICGGIMSTSFMNGSFALAPQPGFGWGHVAGAEIIFTFVLCYVVLCVATTKESSKVMFGLAIGSCVTVGGFAIGAISLGSLNPAVSFGIDTSRFVRRGGFWWHCLVYSAFEFVGAVLAAGVFRITHGSEYPKGAQQAPPCKHYGTTLHTAVNGCSTHHLQNIYDNF